MANPDLTNINAVVVGLGLTGQSCVKFLLEEGANVTAMDSRQGVQVSLDIPVFLGEYDVDILLSADLVLLSPGVDPLNPAVKTAIDNGIEVIGDVELFARYNRAKVIAITGSNGKSTVTSLIYEIFIQAGKSVLMGGNIGLPVLDLLDQKADFLVLELSSFQLERIASLSPMVATVLNVSDDHLDRHLTLEAYQQSKLRIYDNAKIKVVNRDDSLTWIDQFDANWSIGLSPAKQGFSCDPASGDILLNNDLFINLSDCLLKESHNLLNLQAASACALACGVDVSDIKKVASTFSGLAHRFETISTYNNIRWINDSKATNVGATVAAIQSLVKRSSGKLILIAGGDGKGADFSPLKTILRDSVDNLITLGKDGDRIACLVSFGVKVKDLNEAVVRANSLATPGDVVLLSPACASLDMFKNYQHRGDCFSQAVRELAA